MEDESSKLLITPMNKIFQILSSLMNVFKKLFALLQKISTLKSRAFPIDDSIQQINQIFTQIQLLVEAVPENATQQHNRTFQRFMCRIIETVHFNRHKFMQLGMSSLLIQLTNELENNFITFNKQSNLPKCMRMALKIINKYYKINPEVTPRKASFNSRKNIQDKNFYATIGPTQQFRSKKVQNKSETSLSKAIFGINRYFRVTSCLDLDYQNLRNTCFQAKGQNKDLYDDTMERNYLIGRSIAQYSKDFRQYIRKRQQRKNLLRKSKFMEKQTAIHTNHFFEPQKSSLRFKKQFGINTISNFKGGGYLKKNQQIVLPDQINFGQTFQQSGAILTQNNSPNRLISSKKEMVILAMQQRAKHAYQMKKVVISASKLKLNHTSKNNRTISFSGSHKSNTNNVFSKSGYGKQKPGSNPTEMYFSRLKKNLQKIRSNNNVLIRIEKEQIKPYCDLVIE